MRWYHKEVLCNSVRRELEGDEDGMAVWSLPDWCIHHWVSNGPQKVNLSLCTLYTSICDSEYYKWVEATPGHSSILHSQWSTRLPQVPVIIWVLFLQRKTDGKCIRQFQRPINTTCAIFLHWFPRIPWKVKEWPKTWFQNCILSMVQSTCTWQ